VATEKLNTLLQELKRKARKAEESKRKYSRQLDAKTKELEQLKKGSAGETAGVPEKDEKQVSWSFFKNFSETAGRTVSAPGIIFFSPRRFREIRRVFFFLMLSQLFLGKPRGSSQNHRRRRISG
jgi:hypothetical protein